MTPQPQNIVFPCKHHNSTSTFNHIKVNSVVVYIYIYLVWISGSGLNFQSTFESNY